MTPERWQHLDRLFAAALERPPAQRAGFLDAVAPAGSETRRELEELLGAENEAERFLEPQESGLDKGAPPSDDSPGEALNDEISRSSAPHCGPYRLLEPIGEGGMGRVFLAVRDDDEYQRRVAVKVIRRGFESAHVLHRFRAERQILAELEHPNIARLYDGGTAADGRPYLVMEYVEGEPIDRYLEHRACGVDQRLELFRQVLEAVQHAHRHLLVHRDLKPANILVTAAGEVKLVDFGIAKLLDPDRLRAAAETRTGQRMMSPAYASPEQVKGTPVTTASDVYSLGVVLYELLTGNSPYEIHRGAPDAEPSPELLLHELERAICETEPPRASVLAPAERRARLRGDLDNVLAKALAKNPAARYGSVRELGEDLERHRTGLPVLARRATLAYRLRKFIGRHRFGVAAASAILLLLGSLMSSLEIQARRVAAERDKAERVAEFLVDVFEVSRADETPGQSVTARQLLDAGARRISHELAGEPDLRATMLDTMGRVYTNLGLYEEAGSLLGESLELRRSHFGERHPETAEILLSLAHMAEMKGDLAGAEDLARRALEILLQAHGPDDPSVVLAWRRIGLIRNQLMDFDGAEKALREALGASCCSSGEEQHRMAQNMIDLALVTRDRGDLKAAEPLLVQALGVLSERLGDLHPEVTLAKHELARLHQLNSRYDEAQLLFREVLERHRQLEGDDSPDTIRAFNDLGFILSEMGERAEAQTLYREALELQRRLTPGDHPAVATVLHNLASVTGQLGADDEAEELFRESLAMRERVLGNNHPFVAQSRYLLARLLHKQVRLDEAEPVYREAVALAERLLPGDHPARFYPRGGLAHLLIDRGELTTAEGMLREILEQQITTHPPGHWRVSVTENDLGGCLLAQGHLKEAEELLLRSYPVLLEQHGEGSERAKLAAQRLAKLEAVILPSTPAPDRPSPPGAPATSRPARQRAPGPTSP